MLNTYKNEYNVPWVLIDSIPEQDYDVKWSDRSKDVGHRGYHRGVVSIPNGARSIIITQNPNVGHKDFVVIYGFTCGDRGTDMFRCANCQDAESIAAKIAWAYTHGYQPSAKDWWTKIHNASLFDQAS